MKYSYEFKLMCVEKYQNGQWAETPPGLNRKSFRKYIRQWYRMAKACGVEVLKHNKHSKIRTAKEKYDLVVKVLAGNSIKNTAYTSGIDSSLLRSWIKCYKIKGYQGLAEQRRGRPPKEPKMKKKTTTTEFMPFEQEEMKLLKERNAYLEAENAYIKNLIALRKEKMEAQLKAKKLRLSKDFEEKDTH